MGAFTDLIILVHAIILWRATREFSHHLKLGASWENIRKQYNALLQLSILINNAIGTNATLFLLEFIFYYAVVIDSDGIFTNRNPDLRVLLSFTFFIGDAWAIFYFAAETAFQVTVASLLHKFRNVFLIRCDVKPTEFLIKLSLLQKMEELVEWLKRNRHVDFKEAFFLIHDVDEKKIAIRGNHIFPVTFSLLAQVRFNLKIISNNANIGRTNKLCLRPKGFVQPGFQIKVVDFWLPCRMFTVTGIHCHVLRHLCPVLGWPTEICA